MVINHPEYLKLWIATFLSAVGRWIYYTILAAYIHDCFDSQQFAGWVISYMLPIVLFSPIAGFFVDRYNKKNLIIISILGTGCLPLLLYYFKFLPVIYVLCIIDTLFSTILYLATRSWIKELAINKQTFVHFHSWLVIGQLLPNIVGSGIGGYFIRDLSLNTSLFINFFLCILSLLMIKSLKNIISTVSCSENFAANIKEGLLFTWRTFFVWNAIICFSILMFSYSFLNHFFIYFWSEFFSEDTLLYGSSLALSGIFIILGTLGSKRILPQLSIYQTTLVLYICSAFVLLLLITLSFSTSTKLIFLTLFVLIHFFYAFSRNIHTILITLNTGSKFQGRVLSIAYMSWNGSALASILCSGSFIQLLGVTSTLFYYALVSLILCLILAFFNLGLKHYAPEKNV